MKNTIIDKFYELLFPENITCNFCGEDCDKQRESGLCLECVNKLPFNNKKTVKSNIFAFNRNIPK